MSSTQNVFRPFGAAGHCVLSVQLPDRVWQKPLAAHTVPLKVADRWPLGEQSRSAAQLLAQVPALHFQSKLLCKSAHSESAVQAPTEMHTWLVALQVLPTAHSMSREHLR